MYVFRTWAEAKKENLCESNFPINQLIFEGAYPKDFIAIFKN